MNNILRTDSYKITQFKQYPPNTSLIYSYLESRGGLFRDTTFFGLRYYLQKYLAGRFFTQMDIEHAARFCKAHFGRGDCFNYAGWYQLYNKWNGYLPLRIKAVPEGTTVPTGNVLMTAENSDGEFPWLTNYLETLLQKVWYPTTVCTLSRQVKNVIKLYFLATGCDLSGVDFKLVDFGYRGTSSEESAAIGGAAHLVNFSATDTIPGILMAQEFYDEDGMPGFSIPAMEHSTVTSWGKSNELYAFKNMLDQYKTGLVAIVCDSYDLLNAVNNLIGGELKDQVISREGCLVVRPDSGEPAQTVMSVLNALEKKFGTTQNAAGYRTLNPHVRVIQGDGVDMKKIDDILWRMKSHGWAAENVAFGMGGGLLQKVDRDTQKFAIKCSYAEIDGNGIDVFKEAPGKSSKRGRLALSNFGGYHTIQQTFKDQNYDDLLKTVFLNGQVFTEGNSFKEIRQRAAI